MDKLLSSLFKFCYASCWLLCTSLLLSACGSSDDSEPSVPNTPPIADAGLQQNADTGFKVLLDGRNSFDDQGDVLTYLWVITTRPSGSAALLDDDTSATPTFIADVSGGYVLSLVVNDGTVNSETSTVFINSRIPGSNAIPIADAGVPRNVKTGDEFTLDGSGSSDGDGDTLTYTWLFTQRPTGSFAVFTDNNIARPLFTPDVDGAYIIQLTVSDGLDTSAASLVAITSSDNTPPVANAGNNQTVQESTLVNLDGGGSTDVDDDPLTYRWTLITQPSGSTSTLTGSTAATPSFTPDVAGDFIVQLVVNDGLASSDPDTVTITSNANTIPTANAGPDQDVYTDTVVSLNGSASMDLDGDALTYQWTFVSAPLGSNAAFSGGASISPNFTPNVDGDYVIRLLVDDGEDISAEDLVTVTSVTNTAPIANAGLDQNVMTLVLVNLDGSASSDVNSDPLTYLWSFISIPAGSSATLTNATGVTPSFTPDLNGEYALSLVVNDGLLDSPAVNITLTSTGLITYAIVDTSQTTCYNSATGASTGCTGLGHDADYSGYQPSYTLGNGGTTVTDNITDLVWQQSTDMNGDNLVNYADKVSQTNAVSYCANLTLGASTDWRLPSIKELYSIILFNGQDASSYVGTDTSTLTLFIASEFDKAFGDIVTAAGINANDRIIDGQYASSTLNVAKTMVNDDSTFGVNFVDGRIKAYPVNSKLFYVRCVTGNTSYAVNDFVDNNDQTISDYATGLMWQKSDTERANWDDAITECEGASTAAQTDWRLPNVKELQSIVDYSRSPDTSSSAATDSVFLATSFQNEESITDWGYYWASTTHVDNGGDGTNATYISFGRALGYINPDILDAHGAGAQRSNDKLDVINEAGANSATSNGLFYYKGPQGDVLRINNKVRCVRDI